MHIHTYIHKRYVLIYIHMYIRRYIPICTIYFAILTSLCFFTPRFFRDAFGIAPQDFMVSGKASNVRMRVCMLVIQKSHSRQLALCDKPLVDLSNPGASGSLFYLSTNDEFIMKTVQRKEAEFLQKLLPGYYLVIIHIRTYVRIYGYIQTLQYSSFIHSS